MCLFHFICVDGVGGIGYRVLKLLSVDHAYTDAPREAIRRILEQVTGIKHPAELPLDTSKVEWIRMGTTVATNALLERYIEREHSERHIETHT